MSITMTGMNVGTFSSPLIFSTVMELVGTTSMRFPYWVGVFGFAGLAVISLFVKQAVPRIQQVQMSGHPVPLPQERAG
jgi:hypothetical protein